MSELTNIEKAKIFAMYLGCDCKTEGVSENEVETLMGITFMFGEHYALFAPRCNQGYPVEKTKLLLKSLQDISGEDKETIGEIIDPTKEHEDDYNGFTYSFSDVGKSFVEFYINNKKDDYPISPVTFKIVIDKLRELGYDMDNAIELGLAIDIKSLQTTHP